MSNIADIHASKRRRADAQAQHDTEQMSAFSANTASDVKPAVTADGQAGFLPVADGHGATGLIGAATAPLNAISLSPAASESGQDVRKSFEAAIQPDAGVLPLPMTIEPRQADQAASVDAYADVDAATSASPANSVELACTAYNLGAAGAAEDQGVSKSDQKAFTVVPDNQAAKQRQAREIQQQTELREKMEQWRLDKAQAKQAAK